MTGPQGRWWGPTPITAGSTTYFRVGPLELFALRRTQEWRFAMRGSDDVLDPHAEREEGVRMPPEEGFEHARFALAATGDSLVLTPALADRNVVVRPEVPFTVLPGEELTLYVTTPAWLRLSDGNGGQARQLLERPIVMPSETWFGPSTVSGALCYSSRTAARLAESELIPRPSRIASALVLRNSARDPLKLERVSVPVPFLSVFERGGLLWTERLVFERHRDGAVGRVEVANPPGEATRLSGPRMTSSSGGMMRAVSALWS